jgi:signal transduction histidine kinase
VLSNLLGNAIKFTPEGGTIIVRAQAAKDGVRVAVCDSGPGIRREVLPHLFDRYWTARSSGRAGAGLGLYITKGIVEAHGGEVEVDSRPGAGSTFSFLLRSSE